MAKVRLEQRERDHELFIPWLTSLPFAMSTCGGVLMHRVRSGCSVMYREEYSHDAVQYWCGNGTTHPALFAEPRDGDLVCQACEAAISKVSKSRALPTDELLGRHVHKGIKVARQSCCTNKECEAAGPIARRS